MTRRVFLTRSSGGLWCGFPGWLLLGPLLSVGCGDDGKPGRSAPSTEEDSGTSEEDDAGMLADDAGADSGTEGTLPADLPFYRSGMRLRATLVGGADAPLALEGWHDFELDVPCAFRVATDDRVRCLPATGESYAPWPSVFADADCTQPALVHTAECGPPGPYHLVSQSGCQVRSAVHQLARVADTTTFYAKDPEGTCGEYELSDGGALYRLGDALAPTMFVAAEVQNTQGSRLTRQMYVGEDGSLESASPADDERGAEGCELRPVSGSLRCVPFARVYGDDDWWYSAEGCEGQTLAYGNRYEPSCLEPQIGIKPDFENFVCGAPAISLFRPGARTTSTVYDGSARMCIARDAASDDLLWSLYRVGESLSPEYLETVTTDAVGSGRLRLRMHHASDGQPVAYARRDGKFSYQDTLLDLSCELTPTAAHGLRCVPAPTGRYYSDDGCTQPILALPSEECGALPTAVSLSSLPDMVCGEPELQSGPQVFRVGAALPTDTQVFFGEPGFCTPGEASNTGLFAVGDAISLDSLAELVRTRE